MLPDAPTPNGKTIFDYLRAPAVLAIHKDADDADDYDIDDDSHGDDPHKEAQDDPDDKLPLLISQRLHRILSNEPTVNRSSTKELTPR